MLVEELRAADLLDGGPDMPVEWQASNGTYRITEASDVEAYQSHALGGIGLRT